MTTSEEGFLSGVATGVIVILFFILLIMAMSDSMTPNEMCLDRDFWDTTQIGTEFFCIRGSSDVGTAEIWPASWVEKYCTGDGTCDMERAERDGK